MIEPPTIPIVVVDATDWSAISSVVGSISLVLISLVAVWVKILERNTNHKMDMLVEEVRQSSIAKGRLSQQQDDDARRQKGTLDSGH